MSRSDESILRTRTQTQISNVSMQLLLFLSIPIVLLNVIDCLPSESVRAWVTPCLMYDLI